MFRLSSPAFMMKSLYAGGGASGACKLTFFTKAGAGGLEVPALRREDHWTRPGPGSGSRLRVSCTAEITRASKNHGKGWRVQSALFRNFYSKSRTSSVLFPVQRLNQKRFGASTMVSSLNQLAAEASDEASSSDEDMDMDKFVDVAHNISRQCFRTEMDILDKDDASDGNDDQFQLGSMVDEVENLEYELEEELAAMTGGLTGNLPVASNSVCVGIDPDLSGAIAILKSQDNCTVAEVIDVPCITVAVNKRMRRRHDYQSIAAIVRELQAPEGSIAYVEQARPFPKDGKQGWYITGYGYGVWLGILAAAGFTVVPVQARTWKSAMGLCGKEFTKDDSRALASSMFPLLSVQLRRKKDHGRAEALLIAAYGKGMTVTTVTSLDETCSPDRIESPNQPVPLTAILSSQKPPFGMSTTRISGNTPLQ